MIDPRHEHTAPDADTPYWAHGYGLAVPDPDHDANHDWAHFVLKMIGVGMVVVFAAILIGLCSMVLASEMPRGPFLGGPERVDPYSHPATGETDAERAACKPDVFRLCSAKQIAPAAFGDRSGIYECFKVHRRELSPACNSVMKSHGH